MTDHPADHGPFEELAAGYALDALEPADEQRYLRHARDCPTCPQALAGFREVAAALADTAPAAEPRPQLADRIMAVALADLDAGRRPGAQPADSALRAGSSSLASAAGVPRAPDDAAPDTAGPAPGDVPAAAGDGLAAPGDTPARPGHVAGPGDTAVSPGDAPEVPGDAAVAPGDALPQGVVPLRPRPRRWLRPVTAAAAAALIAGGGIWAGLAGTAGGPPPPTATCEHARSCYLIALTGTATHRPVARLMVEKTIAWIVPSTMKANDTADQIYVLWQITGSHRPPLAVGSFDVRPGAHARVRIGTLAAPYHGTLAFAVSLEPGRTIPASPSKVVAIGPVA